MGDDRRRFGGGVCSVPGSRATGGLIEISDMRILYVAYPLLTVSDRSAGGAEQVLWILEREMARRGVDTTVAASAGSSVAGELFSTGEPCRSLDDFQRRNLEHQDRVVEFIRRRARQGAPFDLIHDMSGNFWPRTREFETPLLATLHLPRRFYDSQLFQDIPENVIFNCVSSSQAVGFSDRAAIVVNNGIALDRYEPNVDRKTRAGLLWLGRICEEKAPHLALDIADAAQLPITLSGQVYPFTYHQQYFDRQVAPRLARMAGANFVQTPSADAKRRLLRQARALLVTSQVEETSSLVAMEAAACGTPVIATRRGALPEVVQDGCTGFLEDGVEGAVQALRRLDEIDSRVCVLYAIQNFSSAKMAERYADIYAHSVATVDKPYEGSLHRMTS
jgi:glycosyltransferase involved in cell wall biosynthesis